MKILNVFRTAIAAMMLIGLTAGAANAAGAYPINKPRHVDWSFAGPFGKWDVAQLQRGFKVYREVCSACHSMELVAFRNLADLGYSDEQIKAIASEYFVMDGPNSEGEMFERPAVPADRFPAPFPNQQAAAYANNGAYPPDFSLLAKARAVERGFPTFVFDIFTMYAENGPDYIYSLLTGYTDDIPEKYADTLTDGVSYNPYYIGGPGLAMANPLFDDMVEYDDGAPQTVDQYSQDVAAFMMWAAEPTLVARKAMGFNVMLFLLIFAVLLYLTKKKVWAQLDDVDAGSGSGGGGQAMALAGAGAGSVGASATASGAVTSARAASAPVAGGTKGVTPTATAARAGIDYIDDIELIDGIGATIAKRLKANGVASLVQIATMSAADIEALGAKINARNRPVREEWQKQARELIDGKAPRAAVDRARVEKKLGKKF